MSEAPRPGGDESQEISTQQQNSRELVTALRRFKVDMLAYDRDFFNTPMLDIVGSLIGLGGAVVNLL